MNEHRTLPAPALRRAPNRPSRSPGSRFGRIWCVMALAAVVLGSLCTVPALAQDSALPDPNAPDLSVTERLEALIERIKISQSQLVTMEADFEQRKESMLLLEPETSTGHLWFRSPGSVRWDFTAPADTLVVIDDGQMLTWYRDLGRAERIDVGEQADRVMEYLSASNSLETLQRYFTVDIDFPLEEGDPYELFLEPRFDRVAKRIQEMGIRLHPEGFYPLYLKYVEPDGDVTEFTFDDIKVNEDIGDVFQVAIPDDVEIREIELGGRSSH